MQIRRALGSLAMLLAIAVAQPAGAVTAYQTSLKPPIIPVNVKMLTVTSSTFRSGGTIPFANVHKGCGSSQSQGEDISPQIMWTRGPAGTKSYVVTIFDPDAPTGVGFWHWIVFNIPPSVTSLTRDASRHMPAGAVQGYGDGGMSAYFGPCPPPGDSPHHYWITVSAMNVMFTEAGPENTGAWIAFLMGKAGKVLARGQYVGLYGRR